MCDRCVACNYQVEVFHDRRRVHERTGLFVHTAAQADHSKLSGDRAELLRARSLLETDEVNAFDPGQRCEVSQRDRALPVARVFSISLPGNADLETAVAAQSAVPFAQQFSIR